MIDEKIIKVDYSEEMRKSFIDYAMSVIVDRAIPDVRDGLKPVHRRILYAMYDSGFLHNQPYRKSVATVGETMKKFHPHGDASIYDALVRMTQDFILQYPLIDGHGNFGSIDGDPPAAFRYTESRLKKLTLDVIGDIDQETVDFIPNFDGQEIQPIVLPSKFPNLLVNGSVGIAVGMATNIPPHNLNEVIKAVCDYIDNPNITVVKLLKSIKGPDFPTGGIICNKEVLKEIYETGSSYGDKDDNKKTKRKNNSIRIRSKIEIEDAGYGKTNLVVTEIPYTKSGEKGKLIEKIVDLVKNGELDELSDVRDESGREGIRIVLEVKKGVSIDNLLNKLYKKTPLEDTMSINFLVLVPDENDSHKLKPKTLNLKELIKHYVDFQKEITIRKYRYLLNKEESKKEVLEGLIKAYDIIDLIIEIIRGSKNDGVVKRCLMTGNTSEITFKTKKSEKEAKNLDFSEAQAEAILNLQLRGLVGLEIEKLKINLEKRIKNIFEYKNILENENVLIDTIKKYLNEIKNTYGTKRKTLIEEIAIAEYKEEFKEEELVILVDKFGYIKTIDIISFGRVNEDILKEFKYVFKAINTDKICVFTKEGNLYQIKISDIPKGKIKDKGVPIETIAKYNKETNILIDTFSNIKNSKIIFVTKYGFVKCVLGSEYETNRMQTLATKLDDGDEIIDIRQIKLLTNEVESDEKDNYKHIVMVTNSGFALKYLVSEIPELKKTNKGIKGTPVAKDDFVKYVFFIKDGENKIEKINGKEVNLSRMKTKKRNQLGVKI